MKTVLILEDNSLLRGLLSAVIKSAGHETLEAADGNEALDICRSNEGVIDTVSYTHLTLPTIYSV